MGAPRGRPLRPPSARSSVTVQFSELCFHLRSFGDLRHCEMDAVCHFLQRRVEERQQGALRQLNACRRAFRRSAWRNKAGSRRPPFGVPIIPYWGSPCTPFGITHWGSHCPPFGVPTVPLLGFPVSPILGFPLFPIGVPHLPHFGVPHWGSQCPPFWGPPLGFPASPIGVPHVPHFGVPIVPHWGS